MQHNILTPELEAQIERERKKRGLEAQRPEPRCLTGEGGHRSQGPPAVPHKRPLVHSYDQAAHHLNISRRTLCKLIDAGLIKSVNVSLKRKGIADEELIRVSREGVVQP